ncbi:hypothetical protein U0070_025020 [Myodes glareolus]|uniref:Uncharacterized protein n=1 Tax=Myodes glareolus TaxID=447135 RepID=A0AAW0HTC4_MYOGA
MKKMEGKRGGCTCIPVDDKDNRHQSKLAVQKLHDTDAAKVNSLLRLDCEQACVRLAHDFDDSDTANKIGIT